jgi:hypothetical protein
MRAHVCGMMTRFMASRRFSSTQSSPSRSGGASHGRPRKKDHGTQSYQVEWPLPEPANAYDVIAHLSSACFSVYAISCMRNSFTLLYILVFCVLFLHGECRRVCAVSVDLLACMCTCHQHAMHTHT